MSRVSQILRRGAEFIAAERGLSQKPYVPPQFVDGDKPLLPVAGTTKLIKGVPVTLTGRIIPSNPEEHSREVLLDGLIAVQLATLEQIYEAEKAKLSGPAVQATLWPTPPPVKRKMPEGKSLIQPVKRHVIFKRKRWNRWDTSTMNHGEVS